MQSFFLGFAFFLSFFFAGTNTFAVQSSIAALVNGEMISVFDLESRARPLLLQQKIDPSDPKNAQIVQQAYRELLEQMVQERILLQAAEKAGIRISSEIVERELASRIQATKLEPSAFFEQASKQGFTEEFLRREIENAIVVNQLITLNVTRKVVVTNDEIEAYYKEYEDLFNETNQGYHIALILYPNDAEAEKYASLLKDRKLSFRDAVQRVSVGPNLENGGYLGIMKAEDMAADLLYIVQDMRAGEISPILVINNVKGQVNLIEKVSNPSGNGLDEATRQRITEILREPRLPERYNAYIAELTKKAIVDIRYE